MKEIVTYVIKVGQYYVATDNNVVKKDIIMLVDDIQKATNFTDLSKEIKGLKLPLIAKDIDGSIVEITNAYSEKIIRGK